MINIYYIGGSPCSGKSTVAESIAKKYDFHYFKIDDYLEDYIIRGTEQNKLICTKQKNMTPEQTWMRNPEEQNEEEIQFYSEIFEFIMEDINKIHSLNGIITEGAAFLPDLMKKIDIDQKHYISITPTKEFQISHYKERPWVSYVLEGCKDKEKAFENWMERDALFAKEVRRQCEVTGYQSLITDGTIQIEELVKRVYLNFGMER